MNDPRLRPVSSKLKELLFAWKGRISEASVLYAHVQYYVMTEAQWDDNYEHLVASILLQC